MASVKDLVVGTRIHLGNASVPPKEEKFKETAEKFSSFASSIEAKQAYIAADATPKFENYSLAEALRNVHTSYPIEIIAITPWNNFVPALNAIATRAATDGASFCLFCSAETQTSSNSIQLLLNQMSDDTLVAGAVMPGHDYHPQSIQPLSGTTTPWNTLAIWNVAKLTLTGFPLVGEGIHKQQDGSLIAGGVEEVSTIALIQRILGIDHAKAKLVPLPDVSWTQTFDDEARQKWHDKKMQSKVARPAKHLELLGLMEGLVEHC